VEDRVLKLEATVGDLRMEVKLTAQALASIDVTLQELKSVIVKLSDMQVASSSHELRLAGIDARLKNLDKKVDKTDELVTGLDKRETVSGIKLGSAEKFVWALVSAAFALAVTMMSNPTIGGS